MPVDIFTQLAPFLNKTTAIMTTIIILVVLQIIMVSIEKEINRRTADNLIKNIKHIIKWLLMLEALICIVTLSKYIVKTLL